MSAETYTARPIIIHTIVVVEWPVHRGGVRDVNKWNVSLRRTENRSLVAISWTQ